MADIRVDGLSDLLKRLVVLADVATGKDAQKSVTKALRKSMQVVQKDAQATVRVKSGTLQKNIIVAKQRKPPQGQIEVDVTVRYKAQSYKDNASNRRKGLVGGTYKNYGPLFYGAFLEFGTVNMPAYPFMGPAWDRNKDALPDIFKTELSAAIDAAMAKA